MDVTKLIDINAALPQEVVNAFKWNTTLVSSDYQPVIQAEVRQDGSMSAFITADSKAILFFNDCAKQNKTGRIINDDVTLHPFNEYVLVVAKASVCVDDVVKGTAVAGQVFQIGNCAEMDQCVQFASGIARSRALTNAGYGVVSSVTLPAPNGGTENPAPDGEAGLPFQTNNLVGAAPGNPASAPTATVPSGYPYPGAIAAPSTSASDPNDPSVWAKNIVWPTKRKTMGELLAMSPKDIKWAAENMRDDNDVKRAAAILYPEACRLIGVAPKPLR